MPELPDVEAFRKVLAACAQGRRIQHVEVYDPGVLHGVNAQRLRRDLEGRTFTTPGRHGKWLVARTDGPTVLLHFGMTGRLLCCHPDEALHAHDRVVFTVGSNRQLRYRDQRKLKGLWLADDDSGVARILGPQGPDASVVSRADFDAALSGRRGGIKSVLTDQSMVAGLGNLLADEILWRSRLHPAQRAGDLTADERGRLYASMRRTVRSAVAAGQVPPRASWLTGHRSDSAPSCPRCGEPLSRGRVAGRGTLWCPRCQPAVSASTHSG